MKPNYLILLVEDNLIDQLITTKLLKNAIEDFNIAIVSNGYEAMDWLNNYNQNTNERLIILLDIKMPVMDGFEFLTHYDTLPENLKKDTDVFMLSSTLDDNDLKKAKDNNYVKKLFSKPLSVNQFKEVMHL